MKTPLVCTYVPVTLLKIIWIILQNNHLWIGLVLAYFLLNSKTVLSDFVQKKYITIIWLAAMLFL